MKKFYIVRGFYYPVLGDNAYNEFSFYCYVSDSYKDASTFVDRIVNLTHEIYVSYSEDMDFNYYIRDSLKKYLEVNPNYPWWRMFGVSEYSDIHDVDFMEDFRYNEYISRFLPETVWYEIEECLVN